MTPQSLDYHTTLWNIPFEIKPSDILRHHKEWATDQHRYSSHSKQANTDFNHHNVLVNHKQPNVYAIYLFTFRNIIGPVSTDQCVLQANFVDIKIYFPIIKNWVRRIIINSIYTTYTKPNLINFAHIANTFRLILTYKFTHSFNRD